MLIARSFQRRSATIHCNPKIVSLANRTLPWIVYAATITAALLSGCAGMQSLVSGDESNEIGHQTRATPVIQFVPSSKRTLASTERDILLEWGVFGLNPLPYKKARSAGVVRTSVTMALPAYSASIQEIVANAICRSCEQKPYNRMVLHASNLHGVPSGLIHAVIQKESGYNPGARSRRNARGLMQVTPDTARFVGVKNSDKLYDPQTNINAGAAYLKYLMRTHGTFDHVLAAYNAGPGNVRKYKGVPPFNETRRYVSDVKKYYAATSRELL